MNKKQLKIIRQTFTLSLAVIASVLSSYTFLVLYRPIVEKELLLGVFGAGIGVVIAYMAVRLKVALDAPQIFISYSHKDSDFVAKIYQELSSTPYTVLFDEKEIQVGDNIKEKINEMMENSDYIIFVVSQNSISSDWAISEIKKAKKLNKKVLPIKVDNSEIPEYLKNTMYADFTKSFDSGMDKLIKALKSKRNTKDIINGSSNSA